MKTTATDVDRLDHMLIEMTKVTYNLDYYIVKAAKSTVKEVLQQFQREHYEQIITLSTLIQANNTVPTRSVSHSLNDIKKRFRLVNDQKILDFIIEDEEALLQLYKENKGSVNPSYSTLMKDYIRETKGIIRRAFRLSETLDQYN